MDKCVRARKNAGTKVTNDDDFKLYISGRGHKSDTPEISPTSSSTIQEKKKRETSSTSTMAAGCIPRLIKPKKKPEIIQEKKKLKKPKKKPEIIPRKNKFQPPSYPCSMNKQQLTGRWQFLDEKYCPPKMRIKRINSTQSILLVFLVTTVKSKAMVLVEMECGSH
ncbi:hypothetical protein H6P81_019535 [Aristolochia fimbriata]|uniref:Uncharacterized protein n=1 Tax=Aristolochia fimbriata TaxID=158543 RepID=A0AAV7DRX6_ARIFI|nr:hypothetical protein H6P81_019535 [Aristolochia fimbriata]